MDGTIKGKARIAVSGIASMTVHDADEAHVLRCVVVNADDLEGRRGLLPSTNAFRAALKLLLPAVAQPALDKMTGKTTTRKGLDGVEALKSRLQHGQSTFLAFDEDKLAAMAENDPSLLGRIETVANTSWKRGPTSLGGKYVDFHERDRIEFIDEAPMRRGIAFTKLKDLERRMVSGVELACLPLTKPEIGGGGQGRVMKAFAPYVDAVRQPVYDRPGEPSGEMAYGRAGLDLLAATFGAGATRNVMMDVGAMADIAARRGDRSFGEISDLVIAAKARAKPLEKAFATPAKSATRER